MTYTLLIFSWVVFCGLHSLLATESTKRFWAAKMGSNFKYYRIIYSIIAAITLGAVLTVQLSIHADHFSVFPFIQYFVAFPCAIFAAILMGICIRKYFYRLSGVAVFYEEGHPVLETAGIHKFVRHPLYVGTLLLVWSLLLLFPSFPNLIACMMISVYTRIGISSEERKLIKIFGSQYEDYKKNTPMLFPVKNHFFKISPRPIDTIGR